MPTAPRRNQGRVQAQTGFMAKRLAGIATDQQVAAILFRRRLPSGCTTFVVHHRQSVRNPQIGRRGDRQRPPGAGTGRRHPARQKRQVHLRGFRPSVSPPRSGPGRGSRRWGRWPSKPSPVQGAPPTCTNPRRAPDSRTESGDVVAPCSAG